MKIRSHRDETLLQELTQHQARAGHRRVFLSAFDAAQYDAGYQQPMPENVRQSTPFSIGWRDAEYDSQGSDHVEAA